MLSEPDRLDENLGLDFLGIPGTNGPDRLLGGWPHFDITNYSGIGYAGSANSPYVDDNWQVQYTANATYTKGTHTFRFGGDIVRQAMNRHELGNGSGSFTFAGGPTALSGGPSVNQFNTFASFLLGLPTGVSKGIIPFEDGYTRSRNWQFSFFVKDQWQADAQPHRVDRPALRLLPGRHAHDARHGALRPRDEPMLICGVGIGSDGLRIRHGTGKYLAAARAGLSPDRGHRPARRLRHQLRSVSARVRAQPARQLSVFDQPQPAAGQRVRRRGPAGGRHSRRFRCPM